MSSKRFLQRQRGVTLIEMVVSIVLFGVMAAMGSLLISKLAPSYLASAQAEQALSPREAALWRLSEDFRKSLVYGTSQSGCTLNLNVVSSVAGEVITSQVITYQLTGTTVSQLLVGGGILLDHVSSPNGCIFNWQSGVGSTPTKLGVAFSYTVGADGADSLAIPVSTVLYTYAAAPYAPYIFPDTINSMVSTVVAISGVSFTGMTSVSISGATVFSPLATVLNDSLISATINSPTAGVFDLVVTTPDGKAILKQAVTVN